MSSADDKEVAQKCGVCGLWGDEKDHKALCDREACPFKPARTDMQRARLAWIRDLGKSGLPYPGEQGLKGFAHGWDDGFAAGGAARPAAPTTVSPSVLSDLIAAAREAVAFVSRADKRNDLADAIDRAAIAAPPQFSRSSVASPDIDLRRQLGAAVMIMLQSGNEECAEFARSIPIEFKTLDGAPCAAVAAPQASPSVAPAGSEFGSTVGPAAAAPTVDYEPRFDYREVIAYTKRLGLPTDFPLAAPTVGETPRGVKRYRVLETGDGVDVRAEPQGPYVLYVDYERLERDLAAMTKLNRIHVQELNERDARSAMAPLTKDDGVYAQMLLDNLVNNPYPFTGPHRWQALEAWARDMVRRSDSRGKPE